jgi:prepilin-type N-terminal cleavage/methylation domain-containing protein
LVLIKVLELEELMKKKGFTLIELIAAIAILSIVITAITTAFTSSIQTWKKADVKLDSSAYAQGAIEMLKSPDVRTSQLYKISGSRYYYLYFNNINELKDGVNDFILAAKTGTTSLAGAYNAVNLSSAATSNVFSDCKNNSNSKRYGVYIEFTNNTPEQYFAIKLTLWDFNYGIDSKSIREVNVSW